MSSRVIITDDDGIPTDTALYVGGFGAARGGEPQSWYVRPDDDLDDVAYSDEPARPYGQDYFTDRVSDQDDRVPDRIGDLDQLVRKLANPWRALGISVFAGLTVWLLREKLFGRSKKRSRR